MLQASLFSKFLNLQHGFFTRRNGVSTGPFESLNMGFGKGDTLENVIANRQRAMETFSIPHENLSCLKQVHGSDVHVLEAPRPFDPINKSIQGDAQVTTTPGLAIGVITADCTPILMVCESGKVVGAVHAGWRGLLAGVIDRTIDIMAQKGATNIHAAIGPSIQQNSYEVGPEVKQAFVDISNDFVSFFAPSQKPDHSLLDLSSLAHHQLTKAGLCQVDALKNDTYKEEQDFFSCRRSTHKGETAYGNQLSAIMIR